MKKMTLHILAGVLVTLLSSIFCLAQESEMKADVSPAIKTTGEATTADRLLHKLDECAAAASEPLLREHFLALRVIVEQRRQFGMMTEDGGTSVKEEIEECAVALLADLEGSGGRWETFLNGRPLVMLAPNFRDKSLQIYGLSLPTAWKPEVANPLVVKLHGSMRGVSPLQFSLFIMGFNWKPGEVAVGPRPASNSKRSYLGVIPYLRGNLQMNFMTDLDLTMILAHAGKRARVDDDRVYCSGFSLGRDEYMASGV